MAIAALSIGATGESPSLRRARAMGVAIRFAIGHALLLALGAGGLIVLGWSLPLVVERGGEMLGGILLIVFGLVGLWSVAAGRVYSDFLSALKPKVERLPEAFLKLATAHQLVAVDVPARARRQRVAIFGHV